MDSMFRRYDVRGVYGDEVSEEKFERLGAAYSLRSSELVMAGDYRAHNDSLKAAFLSSYPGRVRDAGVCPTSVLAYAARGEGVMFTASHNPPEFAGLKPFIRRHEATELEMLELAREYDALPFEYKKSPATVEAAPELVDQYVEALPAFEGGIYDLGGGAACRLKTLFKNKLFSDPDPYFRSRASLPDDSSLTELRQLTLSRGQVGFAFDGDADRLVVVDDGKVVDGGIIAAFLARQLLAPGDSIVVNIDFRNDVKAFLREEGYRVAVSAVGTNAVYEAVLATGARFGAERNGHYVLTRHMPASDAFYPAAMLSSCRPGELAAFAGQFTNEFIAKALRIRADMHQLAAECESAGATVRTVDGVLADFEDYILLIRQSNTEPVVRINSEAKSRELALAGLKKAEELLSRCSK